jgi:ABC-type branched-subunit amino acid transport system permease subunit
MGIDRSMLRHALEAIAEDEDDASAAGVHVAAEKLKITVVSAMMTGFARAIYYQYQMVHFARYGQRHRGVAGRWFSPPSSAGST